MSSYLLRRLAQIIPSLFIVSAVVFMVVHLIPGDPARIIAGPNAREEQLQALTRQFGLDRPLPVQYLLWLRNALTGNMGHSFINDYPVNRLILQRVPATLELTLVASLLTVVIALPLGVGAALRPGSFVDLLSTCFAAVSFAVPTFWMALVMIMLFSLNLHWLPPSGRPELIEEPVLHLKALVMPALTLSVGTAAKVARYLRSSMVDVLARDHVRTARGKGLRERAVIARHVLRNALIPVVTVLGLQTGDLLSGAIIVESIYAWPGVGRLTLQAIGWRDYSLLQADILYIVLAFMVINLMTDMAYAVIDPRIRHER